MIGLTPTRFDGPLLEIQERVAVLPAGQRAELDDGMAVTFEEHFKYQEMQARAHAEGVLEPGEAQLIYVALGEVGDPGNGGWASGTDLATKVLVTQVMGELLAREIGRRR